MTTEESINMTPLNELIEYINKYSEAFGMVGLSIKDKAVSLLDKERKIRDDVYSAGYQAGCSDTETVSQNLTVVA